MIWRRLLVLEGHDRGIELFMKSTPRSFQRLSCCASFR
jgi:hypothetical protein